jgi:recombination protein RecA
MPSAQHLRAQIEATLAGKIPSALTPLPRAPYSLVSTGIREIDELLHGGLPIGAISEIVGPECSGRTSLALALVAGMTRTGKVCAWVDVSDTLHPESAVAIGVDLERLLWIRCGASPSLAAIPQSSAGGFPIAEKQPKPKPGLPQGGGSHPRMARNRCTNHDRNLSSMSHRIKLRKSTVRSRPVKNRLTEANHGRGLHKH